MSTDNTIEDNVEVSEEVLLEDAKAKAKLLGITFHPQIGLTKLKDKINLHLQEFQEEETPTETKVGIKSKGPRKTVKDFEDAARKQHRVIITDNDPLDIENPTIIQGVQNAYFKVGPVIIRKDTEQFVPHCVLESLKSKTMIKWVPSINTMTKKPTGNKVAEVRKRYNISYL